MPGPESHGHTDPIAGCPVCFPDQTVPELNRMAAAQPTADPITCRQLARWLYAFATTIEGFAVSHDLSGDVDGAYTLTANAEHIRSVAMRLDDQKGIVRDAEMLVLLLQQARPYVSGEPRTARHFMTAQDIVEGIDRHAPAR
jgi:hypothetical protein